MTAENSQPVAKLPLVEVILGVQFASLPRFTNAYLGAFWKELGPEWPLQSDAPFLLPQFEKFGEEEIWSEIKLRFTANPPTRLQIRKQDGSRMIQIQNG